MIVPVWVMVGVAGYDISKDPTRFAGAVGRGASSRAGAGTVLEDIQPNQSNRSW